MAVETQPHLIAPHGGYLVDRTGPRPDNAGSLEQVPLTSRELSDLDMLVSGAGARSCGSPRGLRRARMEPRGRLPDPQPDPPRARVPDEGRARDRRRTTDPSPGRRHQVRRRAGRNACRVLPDTARELLPAGPRRP